MLKKKMVAKLNKILETAESFGLVLGSGTLDFVLLMVYFVSATEQSTHLTVQLGLISALTAHLETKLIIG